MCTIDKNQKRPTYDYIKIHYLCQKKKVPLPGKLQTGGFTCKMWLRVTIKNSYRLVTSRASQ